MTTKYFQRTIALNKGNNKFTELWTLLQMESKNL
jgi:hypothetical protein